MKILSAFLFKKQNVHITLKFGAQLEALLSFSK